MLILIILGTVTILFSVAAIITYHVFDTEVLRWVFSFLAILCLIVFIVILCIYISCNIRIKYINNKYDKKYTIEEYFYNGDLIELDICVKELYDMKLRIDSK